MRSPNYFTTREKDVIRDNMRAFTHNFGEVKITKDPYRGYYIHYPASAESWIYYAETIEEVNGWLYGIVQGFMRGEFKNNYKGDI